MGVYTLKGAMWRYGISVVVSVVLMVSSAKAGDTIRLLCIGNSFSWDAVEQELAPLCASAGQAVEIGNLYYGGCSLAQHHAFLSTDSMVYSFRRIRNGVRTVEEPYSLHSALVLQKWDYISFQQASHDSGKRNSYEPYLSALIDSVRRYQPQARLCWMMTWSYAQDASHPAFGLYEHRQDVMNDSILHCTQSVLQSHPELLLIPCGTAIQNARHKMGDTLCRDGYHLNYLYGRYVASCVWAEVLCGKRCTNISYRNSGMSRRQQKQAQQSAHQAIVHPFLQKNTKKVR